MAAIDRSMPEYLAKREMPPFLHLFVTNAETGIGTVPALVVKIKCADNNPVARLG